MKGSSSLYKRKKQRAQGEWRVRAGDLGIWVRGHAAWCLGREPPATLQFSWASNSKSLKSTHRFSAPDYWVYFGKRSEITVKTNKLSVTGLTYAQVTLYGGLFKMGHLYYNETLHSKFSFLSLQRFFSFALLQPFCKHSPLSPLPFWTESQASESMNTSFSWPTTQSLIPDSLTSALLALLKPPGSINQAWFSSSLTWAMFNTLATAFFLKKKKKTLLPRFLLYFL